MNHLKRFITFIIVLLSINAFGQNLEENQVPKIIKDSFKQKYPDAYVYEWEYKRQHKIYEAEFIAKGNKYESYFTHEGVWVKTERDIKKEELPQNIWEALTKTEYAHWKVDDIEEHNTPEHGILYELELKDSKKKVYLYFLPDGSIIDKYIK
jgi:hypothetical protein